MTKTETGVRKKTVMAHATEANELLRWDSSPPRAVVQSFGNTPTLIPQARDRGKTLQGNLPCPNMDLQRSR